MMKEKQCFKCKQNKPLSEYYKHNAMKDGHLNKCKDCTCKDTKVHTDRLLMEDPSFMARERARGRDKYQRLYKGVQCKPTVKSKAMANWQNKYPEKKKATTACQHIECKPNQEKHHWSYNEKDQTDVIIIHHKTHAKIHRYMHYDPKQKMYRSLDGTLLDTREKHEKYISIAMQLF